ncbi:MAG TPA: radical SAM protein [Gemmatimonadales bacterium]|nr:radical SAM protein [Gemmatimonadales bacterium]
MAGAATAQLSLPVLDDWSRLGSRGSAAAPVVEFVALPVRSVLNSPESTRMGFWSVNPYVGCEFGCGYCYARDTHRWTVERAVAAGAIPPGTDPDGDFERRILVKRDAPALLGRALRTARLEGRPIVIGTATDPYQPAELRFGVTRRLLEVLLDAPRLELGIITKSPLVVRDLDLLVELARRHGLKVNISLACTDARLLHRLERRSPGPGARLRALAALRAAGIGAGLMVAPVIPGVTDSLAQLDAVAAAARAAGAQWVQAFPLRLGPASRRTFLPLLAREFPALLARYERAYARTRGAPRRYAAALSDRMERLRARHGFPLRAERRSAEVTVARSSGSC